MLLQPLRLLQFHLGLSDDLFHRRILVDLDIRPRDEETEAVMREFVLWLFWLLAAAGLITLAIFGVIVLIIVVRVIWLLMKEDEDGSESDS